MTRRRREREGHSFFYKDESGAVFHTYSCYDRGNDKLNIHYHYLDLVPKGRDEGAAGRIGCAGATNTIADANRRNNSLDVRALKPIVGTTRWM